MLKKCLASLTVFLLCWLFGGNAPAQHTYRPEDRIVLHGSECRIAGPDLDSNVFGADLIVDAAVVTNGALHARPYRDREARPLPEKYPMIIYTEYTLSVKEVWYGECEPNLTLHISGFMNGSVWSTVKVPKPQRNDRLILFLEYDPYVPDIYYLVDDEYSMLAVNPDGTLYPFGWTGDPACCDGSRPADLRAAVRERVEHFDELWKYYDHFADLLAGKLAKDYLTAQELSEEKETT